MTTNYVDNPHNFNEIEPYVIIDKEQITIEIITAKKCYFYDACSFRWHTQVKDTTPIFEFIKNNDGIVVITRTILMELASHSGVLNAEYIEYIKDMYTNHVKVLVVYEEDLFDVLDMCFASNVEINRCLSRAVKVVKTRTSTIEEVLNNDRILLNSVMSDNVSDGTLFKRFFSKVRNSKESGDSLGEQLITICCHILSNIPEKEQYKYVVLTDDKKAIGLINKTSNNVYEHRKVYSLSAVTTVKLVQRLYNEGLIKTKEKVEELLAICATKDIIKVWASEEYDLRPVYKTFNYKELAQKIITSYAIHINY